MYQATTPTLTLQFPSTSVDLTTLGTCWITVVQGDSKYKIENPTVTAHAVSFTLTQAQTQAFESSMLDKAQIQANFLSSTGTRVASNICKVKVNENLDNTVVTA